MACVAAVAHRAALHLRLAIPVVAALVVAVSATVTSTAPARAAYAPRVVIVVGPTGGATRDYLSHARVYAAQARAKGARVSEIYTPHATWSRVLAAAQGANVFIYLGHGNGWPSPYRPFQERTKNGLGLNPSDGASNYRVKYYGADYIRAHIRLAPGAVVLLNRLCYASGSGEPGMANPTWTTAVRRVDNFAAGFLGAGASTVLADGHTSLAYEIPALFAARKAIASLWAADPDSNRHLRSFPSKRSPGYVVRLDPDSSGAGFYRSIVTSGRATNVGIRIAALAAKTRAKTVLRAGPGADSASLGFVPKGETSYVRAALAVDRAGRTWVPIVTRAGVKGYVAGWLTTLGGSARARTAVFIRSKASTSARKRASLKAGVRVTVFGSAVDAKHRAWLKVRTSAGTTGYVAAWLTQP